MGFWLIAGLVMGACRDDVAVWTPSVVVSARGPGVEVVGLEVLTCTNRITRGVAVALGSGRFVTAGHTVTNAAEIRVQGSRATLSAQTVVIDPRRDLALVDTTSSPPGAGIATLSVGSLDPDAVVDLITPTSSRSITVDREVLVRARRPDGSIREWDGVLVLGDVSRGESGAPLVQDGHLVGLMVLAERRAPKAYAVAPSEISAFFSELHVDTADTNDDYSVAIQSGTPVNPAIPVGAACR